MCTSARMIYQLTYRAIRAYASGQQNSVNPMEAMRQLETAVPFAVCNHTHTVMLLAQRSFNQRHLAPVGVHEPILSLNVNRLQVTGKAEATELLNSHSDLRHTSPETIHARLHFMKLQQYAAGVTHKHSHLFMLECAERMTGAQVKAHMPAKPFDYVQWTHSL